MPTVPELFTRATAAFGGRTAVVEGARSITFDELRRRATRLANALATVAHPGDRVGIIMPNRLEYVEVDFAIALAGMVKVPVNTRLSDDERAYVLNDSGAAVVIAESADHERIRAMLATIEGPPVLVVLDEPISDALTYDDLLRAADTPIVPLADPERLSQLLYTSGTTGRPKAAMLSDRCRVAGTTMMLAEELEVRPTDGMIHAGSLAHGSGSKVLAYLSRGARNVVLPSFSPGQFVDAVSRGGTSTFLVPTMIQMLVDSLAGTPPSRLRNITYGGAAISRPALEAALDRFGPIFTQVYGSCEAPHPVLVLRHRDEDDPALRHHDIVPAGRPVLGVEVRLAPTDDTADADVGELCVSGPNVMTGYWGRPDATAEAIVDGWYHTGDVARRSADGRYTIVDRVKDMIISGGLNVYPAEVERVLREHPAVSDCCVVGIPDERWGEQVAVAVVPQPGTEFGEQDVAGWCADRLAGYKKPRRVVVADRLPTGSTGKIIRREVTALFQIGTGA
jgi:acyl-CoA synthetase (AMP-forming)/AMP-acid ligase II